MAPLVDQRSSTQNPSGILEHNMSVFNVSFANKKTQSSGQDYGILVDQLDILESTLSADGKLSPGDYQLLTQKAQQLYGHPGLSPAQRSNIEVKISSYKSAGSKSTLKDAQDITQLNNEVKDDQRKASIMAGNNPTVFLKSQAAIQSARVRQLADAVNSLDASGSDSSAHMNEYNDALSTYQDTLKALDYVEKHTAGSAPSSDYAAYITTNSDGEIVGVNVAREGSQSGYLETNGLYGGLKIYGKLNHKENGKNVFMLGNQRYSGTDVVVPGPDGTMKTSTLVNESMQKGKAGIFTTAVAGYSDMDPASVRTQSTIRSGGYAQGSKGFIYKKNDDGSYTKYVNATPEKLQISDNQIIKLPNSMEQSILGNVTSTIDSSMPAPTLPVPPTMTPTTASTSAPVSSTSPGMSRMPAGSPPPQPTDRSPQSSQGLAQRVMGGAKSFLAGLFGTGQ